MGSLKNTIIGDKLKDLKLDFSDYGKLPPYADVILIKLKSAEDNKKDVFIKKWEKLNYIRKHLKIIDDYISKNKGENLKDWLVKNNIGISDHVKKQIGNFNNETGGISGYFYNLQNLYDQEEAQYDEMEADAVASPEVLKYTKELRDEREKKRDARAGHRKILVKDLKKDGKGYLYVDIEEEEPAKEKMELAADGKNDVPTDGTPTEKVDDKAKELGQKVKSKTVFIAGFAILLTLVIAGAASAKKNE